MGAYSSLRKTLHGEAIAHLRVLRYNVYSGSLLGDRYNEIVHL